MSKSFQKEDGLIRYSHFDDLVQGCSNSIANALELLQSCTKFDLAKHAK